MLPHAPERKDASNAKACAIILYMQTAHGVFFLSDQNRKILYRACCLLCSSVGDPALLGLFSWASFTQERAMFMSDQR